MSKRLASEERAKHRQEKWRGGSPRGREEGQSSFPLLLWQLGYKKNTKNIKSREGNCRFNGPWECENHGISPLPLSRWKVWREGAHESHQKALLSSRETKEGSRDEEEGLGCFGLALASEENKRDKGISQKFPFHSLVLSSPGQERDQENALCLRGIQVS